MKKQRFFIIPFILVIGFITFIILSLYNCWVFPEMTGFPGRSYYALEHGLKLSSFDIIDSFNWFTHDGGSRARFVSFFFNLINTKLRVYFWNFMPPHPSLSLTWIFTLILSPVFLFKLMMNLTSNKSAASASVLFFLAAPGILSGVALLYHPAKPLAVFFMIFCLYFTSVILKDAKKRNNLPLLKILILAAILFLTFNTDEIAYFIIPAAFIFFPEISSFKKKNLIIGVIYVFSFVFFLVFTSFAVPRINKYLNQEPLDFWGFIQGTHEKSVLTGRDEGSILNRLKLINIIKNADGLISSHIIPFRIHTFNHRKYFYLFWLFCFVLLFLKLSPKNKKLFIKSVIVILFFFIFHTAIMARHYLVTYDCYYHGNLFSLFFIIPLSIILFPNTKSQKPYAKILFCILLFSFAFNFYEINKKWKIAHLHISRLIPEGGEILMQPNIVLEYLQTKKHPFFDINKSYINLNFPALLKIWKNRNNPVFILKAKNIYGPTETWLFQELYYTSKNDPRHIFF